MNMVCCRESRGIACTLIYVAPMRSHSFLRTAGGLFWRASTAPLPSRTPPKTSRATSNAVATVALRVWKVKVKVKV